MPRLTTSALALLYSISAASIPAVADAFYFSTGNPDGKIATLARPGQIETESADDFLLGQTTVITQATFTGLLPAGAPLSSITSVGIELYHVFPVDSTLPPDDKVVTRTNSPSDIEFADPLLTFTTTLLNPSFTVSNTVVNGINPKPTQFTGGKVPSLVRRCCLALTSLHLSRLTPVTTFSDRKSGCRMATFCGSPLRVRLSLQAPHSPRICKAGYATPIWTRIGSGSEQTLLAKVPSTPHLA